MHRYAFVVVVVVACGSKRGGSRDADAVDAMAAACAGVRPSRTAATALDHDGHVARALAKINEANAACPGERATSAVLEARLMADLGQCPDARALAAEAGAPDVKTTCDALDAASKGTVATMRTKAHEAFSAEIAKDYAKARALYEAAWTELHPNPHALEDAARMAGLAGDAIASRRLRDRALAEAEATEHAKATITYDTRGYLTPRLRGATLFTALGNNVFVRDAAGETHFPVVAPFTVVLTQRGTLAYTSLPLVVYDTITGSRLIDAQGATTVVASADDSRIAALDVNAYPAEARVYDVATGKLKTKLSETWFKDHELVGFGPDAGHLVFCGGKGDAAQLMSFDVTAGASTPIATTTGCVAALSNDGHELAYLDDSTQLRARNLVKNEDGFTRNGRFLRLTSLAITNDGSRVATGSPQSLRVWTSATDVERKFSSVDAMQFNFSDDDKTLVMVDSESVVTKAPNAANDALAAPAPLAIAQVIPYARGIAFVGDHGVEVIAKTGDPRMLCASSTSPIIDAAFSASGKLLVCRQRYGAPRILDADTGAEKAKLLSATSGEPTLDFTFSADDTSMDVVTKEGRTTYDVATGKTTARTSFIRPGTSPSDTHARFDDGRMAVAQTNGSVALFDSAGVWQRDIKVLPTPTGATVRDAFATSGARYAIVVGSDVHTFDLATGAEETTTCGAGARSVAISSDGATVAVTLEDHSVVTIRDGKATTLANAAGDRVAFVGTTLFVWTSKSEIAVYAKASTTPLVVHVGAEGILVQEGDAFDLRGKPSGMCTVGALALSLQTCADRAKDDLVPRLISATTR